LIVPLDTDAVTPENEDDCLNGNPSLRSAFALTVFVIYPTGVVVTVEPNTLEIEARKAPMVKPKIRDTE
jgi:hypothetical protein